MTTSSEHDHRWGIVALPLSIAAMAGLVACGTLQVGAVRRAEEYTADHVAAASGWTRTTATDDLLFVINVLPAEEMFTHAQHLAEHPTEGELIIDGEGLPIGSQVRHVEVHIYDRATGLALDDLHPTLTVTNRTTGEVIDVPATLMQDVNIGPLDVHYGNNVFVPSDSDLTVTVGADGGNGWEEVSVDGHLD